MTPWIDLFMQGLVQGLGFWTAALIVLALVAVLGCGPTIHAIGRGPRMRDRK